MKIFLSYASKDRDQAEKIYYALISSGHEVFLDKSSLSASGDFNSNIDNAINKSDCLVFLISPDSVRSQSYALTELKLAEDRWRHPKGKVLPVLIKQTDLSEVPNYLKSITIFEPHGNVAAETKKEVERLFKSGQRIVKIVGIIFFVTIFVVGGYILYKDTIGKPSNNLNMEVEDDEMAGKLIYSFTNENSDTLKNVQIALRIFRNKANKTSYESVKKILQENVRNPLEYDYRFDNAHCESKLSTTNYRANKVEIFTELDPSLENQINFPQYKTTAIYYIRFLESNARFEIDMGAKRAVGSIFPWLIASNLMYDVFVNDKLINSGAVFKHKDTSQEQFVSRISQREWYNWIPKESLSDELDFCRWRCTPNEWPIQDDGSCDYAIDYWMRELKGLIETD